MVTSSVSGAADRVHDAMARLLPLADAIWEPVAGEADAAATGVVTATSVELRAQWRPEVEVIVGPVDWAALTVVDQARRTRRTAHFAPLHARINEVYALDPTARW